MDIFFLLAKTDGSGEALTLFLQIAGFAVSVIAIITAMLSRRKQADEKALSLAIKQYVDEAVAGITPTLETLKQAGNFRDVNTSEFKRQTEDALKRLDETVRTMSGNCVRHQHSGQNESIVEIRKELDRLSQRLIKLDDLFRDYQDTVGDKYVQINSYRHDLKMWTNVFNSFRQSIHDLSTIVSKLVELRDQ
jgi:hypothetical protein